MACQDQLVLTLAGTMQTVPFKGKVLQIQSCLSSMTPWQQVPHNSQLDYCFPQDNKFQSSMKATSFLLGLQDCKEISAFTARLLHCENLPGCHLVAVWLEGCFGGVGVLLILLFPFSLKLLALRPLRCKARETDRHSISAVLLHVWSNAADIQIDGTWQLIPKSPLLFVHYFLPFPSQHIQAFLDPPKRAHFFLPGFWSTRLFNSEGTYSWHPRKVGDQQL